jgi:hypothetical protein
MATTQFTTELKACDFRMVRSRIVSEDCPGVTWKPGRSKVFGGAICRRRPLRHVHGIKPAANRYLMSGITIALTVAGCVLLVIALLAFVGLFAAGLGA